MDKQQRQPKYVIPTTPCKTESHTKITHTKHGVVKTITKTER